MIQLASKRKKPEHILKEFPDAILADVTTCISFTRNCKYLIS